MEIYQQKQFILMKIKACLKFVMRKLLMDNFIHCNRQGKEKKSDLYLQS